MVVNKIVELQREQNSPTRGANVFCGVGLTRSWGQQLLSTDDTTHRRTLQRRQELQQGPHTETRNENPQHWNSKDVPVITCSAGRRGPLADVRIQDARPE